MPFPSMPAANWHKLWSELLIKGDPGPAPETGDAPMECAQAFAQARVNFAENLLESGLWTQEVLSHWNEDGKVQSWSRSDLKEHAGRFAACFAGLGLKSGDRVLLALPQVPQKLAALLGASWNGIVCILIGPSRLGEVKELPQPVKLAIVPDGTRFDGKWRDGAPGIEAASRFLPDDGHVVVVPNAGSRSDLAQYDKIFPWEDWQRMGKGGGVAWHYQAFHHPLAHVWNGHEWAELYTGSELLRGLSLWKLEMALDKEETALFLSKGRPRDMIPAACALSTGARLVLNQGAISAMNNQIAFRIMEREGVDRVVLGPGTEHLFAADLPSASENHFLQSVKKVHALSGKDLSAGIAHHFPQLAG